MFQDLDLIPSVPCPFFALAVSLLLGELVEVIVDILKTCHNLTLVRSNVSSLLPCFGGSSVFSVDGVSGGVLVATVAKIKLVAPLQVCRWFQNMAWKQDGCSFTSLFVMPNLF